VTSRYCALNERGRISPAAPHTVVQSVACVQALPHDVTDCGQLCNLKLACLSRYSGEPEVKPVMCTVNWRWQQRVAQTVNTDADDSIRRVS